MSLLWLWAFLLLLFERFGPYCVIPEP